ncbi:L-aspartate oxidase [Bacillus gobiensis]
MSKPTTIIIGSGIAALSCAATMPSTHKLLLITKQNTHDSNSILAQGGIAAAIDREDSTRSHINDTLVAGAGHNDEIVVKEAIEEGKDIIQKMITSGFPFDRDVHGTIDLGKEGAHSQNRIVHAGSDATGEVLIRHFLYNHPDLEIAEHETAVELVVSEDECAGVVTKQKDGKIIFRKADHVVLATGGCGNLYTFHSNQPTVTGDGLSLAYRAGARLTDMEFLQFHPTMLVKTGKCFGLISEAVRGEGAQLVDESGREIMNGVHPQRDLASRDIVARQLFKEQQKGHQIFLDIRGISHFSDRFPTISRLCEKAGVLIKEGKIPVSPGMHFLMGGVEVNRWGETNIKRLFAIGEVSCTGLHGANRLASNSLLEGLVFGKRAAEKISNDFSRAPSVPERKDIIFDVPQLDILRLKEIMTAFVGIVRSKHELEVAAKWLDGMSTKPIHVKNITKDELETFHLYETAKRITASALAREESRGAHFREDYKQTDPDWAGKKIIHEKGKLFTEQREGEEVACSIFK